MDELVAAQERIGRALSIAAVGEDPQVRKKVREEGEQFVRLLNGLLRLTRTHELTNQAFDAPCREFGALIGRLVGLLGVVHLVIVEDQVYINEIRIRLDKSTDDRRALDSELHRHNVGGLTFFGELSGVEVKAIIACFASKSDGGAPRTALMEALQREGVDRKVELAGVFRYRTTGEAVSDVRQETHRIGERALNVVEEFWDAAGSNRLQNALPARRVVTELLDAGVGAEALVEEPSRTSVHGLHAWRVCQLALIMGRGAGLGEAELQDLGLCALFHDVGYAAREGAVPARDGRPAEPGYAPPFERHAAAGARLLLSHRGFSEAKVRRALGILEHHRDNLDPRGRPCLFARIVRIADDYETLVRAFVPPSAPRPGLSPAEALGRMARHVPGRYDPALFQLLINHLGRFPPGTRIQLKDGRVVRVVSGARSPGTFDKPRCVVTRLADGSVPDEEIEVDLAVEGEILRVLRG